MKIAFYGGQTAGYVSLLSLLAKDYSIITVYPEDNKIRLLAKLFDLKIAEKEKLDNAKHLRNLAKSADLLICCHARKILSKQLVDTVPSINLHPCLYKYRGGNPIQRLIADKNPKASVACHWMIEKVDAGKTIFEEFIEIKHISTKSEAEVYNELYPHYVSVLHKSLNLIGHKLKQN